MKSFLDHLAEQLIKRLPAEEWDNLLILFPNRRPAHFFKRALASKLKQPVWNPASQGIEDFAYQQSGLSRADRLESIFLLFEEVQKHLKSDAYATIDRFMPLGEVILQDFQEIDNYLVDTNQLFKNISSLKDIEKLFGNGIADMESFQRFWSTFSDQQLKPMQEEFLSLWNILGSLYQILKEKLHEQKLAYEGMAFREVAEEERLELPAETRIVIAGFNALTPCELQIFRQLKKDYRCWFAWDYDDYYLKDKNQEAGLHLRKAIAEFGLDIKIDASQQLGKSAKHIVARPVAGAAANAQALAHDVKDLPKHRWEQSAIVLPNESLLPAVLQTLPSHITERNLTMGFPIKNSPYFTLINQFFELHKHSSSQSSPTEWLLPFLRNPLLRLQNKPKSWNQSSLNKPWLSQDELQELLGAEDHALYIRPLGGTLAMLARLRLVFIRLMAEASGNPASRAILLQLIKLSNRLEDLLADKKGLSLDSLWKIFRSAAESVKVPFEGEPIKGIQIMGFLESRLLDFKNLYVLSANEGSLPPEPKSGTLIPFHLRLAFSIPTFRDNDALASYNFYRLLQRSEQAHIYYSAIGGKGLQGGERSRYIHQLIYEWSRTNPKANLEVKALKLKSKSLTYSNLVIEKDAKVMEALARFKANDEGESERYLSPSALNLYIKSPIAFYFRHVADFREETEWSEQVDPIRLGNVVHNTMEALYQPYLRESLNASIIDEIMHTALPEILPTQFEEQMGFASSLASGKNLLSLRIMEQYCRNILEHDKSLPELMILALELGELSHFIRLADGSQVRLAGKIDRVDQIGQLTRIVDYKTGKVWLPKEGDYESVFDDPAKSAAFQAYFYSLIYFKNHPGQSVKPTIYALKSPNEMDRPLSKSAISLEQLKDYELHLQRLIQELFDPSIPFKASQEKDEYLHSLVKPAGFRY